MDFRGLANHLDMEKDEFLEVLNLFLDVSDDELRTLQSALDKGDPQKAARAAHSIKGAAINLGLLEMYEFAKSMEKSTRENHVDEAYEMAKRAKVEIDRIRETLGQERQKI